jgi:hypothetical protein
MLLINILKRILIDKILTLDKKGDCDIISLFKENKHERKRVDCTI